MHVNRWIGTRGAEWIGLAVLEHGDGQRRWTGLHNHMFKSWLLQVVFNRCVYISGGTAHPSLQPISTGAPQNTEYLPSNSLPSIVTQHIYPASHCPAYLLRTSLPSIFTQHLTVQHIYPAYLLRTSQPNIFTQHIYSTHDLIAQHIYPAPLVHPCLTSVSSTSCSASLPSMFALPRIL